MKKIVFLLFMVTLFDCSKNPESFIEHINGYWEIESVTLSNGTKKDYTINQTIDHISIQDSLKGFRKKMNPKFDGKYETSNTIEIIQLKIENDSLNLYYSTAFSKWKETVLIANEKHLKIVNQNNDVYLYKHFIPILAE